MSHNADKSAIEEDKVYEAKAFKIFIAASSDITNERSIVRNIIEKWNTVNAQTKGIILRPVGWEHDAYPSMKYDRPQENINKQIRRSGFARRRLLDAGRNSYRGYMSGSIEEVEKHINAGKPAMLFFSNTPVSPDGIDHEQLVKLQNFKEWCRKKGLVSTYNSPEDFAEQWRSKLGLFMNNDAYILNSTAADVETGLSATNIADKLSDYARKMLLKKLLWILTGNYRHLKR